MGGIVDGGAGIGIKTSPRRAAIEKAQAELRQEYDVREKRRRELEFLEKGGNPLDFKFGNVASVSGQSTSPIDRHPEQFVSCEAKGSFALTASPHGDSIESSGRPGAPPICEPNSADNLLLFDSENELPEGSKKSMRTDRKNFVVPSVQSSHMDGSRSAKESEESAIFRPYARRNRSRLNRDGARLTSGDPVNCRIGHGSSMAARASSKDSKGPTVETNNHREQNARVAAKGDYVSTNGDMLSKVTPENCLDVAIDDVNKALESSANLKQMGIPEDKSDVAAQGSRDEQCDQSLQAFGQEKSVDVACGEADLIREGENIFSDSLDHQPSTATANVENEITCQLNSVSDLKRNDKLTTNEIEKISTAVTKKGLDSESSCAPSLAELKTDAMSIESSGTMEGANSEIEKTQKLAAAEMVVEHSDIKTLEGDAVPKNVHYSSHQMHVDEEAINGVEGKVNGSDDQLGIIKYSSNIDVEQATVDLESKGSKLAVVDPNANQEKFSARPQESADQLSSDIQKSSILEKEVTSPPKLQVPCNQSKLEEKMHEDSVLEEARMIEAKRKRIAELSVGTIALERRKRSHWDFVLEEMAWLANDFVQERLWKMTAAAQLSHRIACYSRFKIDQQSQQWKIRKVAYTLAKAVMQFWHSAEALLNIEDSGPSHAEVSDSRAGTSDMKEGSSNKSVLEIAGKQIIPVQRYAVQFLRENNPPTSLPAEVPKTPDRMSYSDSLENSWENHLTEESLFYTVPPGAMETYRKSIESYVIHREKVEGNIEEVNKSTFDVAEYGYQENAHNELEGETSAYYLPGAFEGSRSLKFAQKKRKNPTRSFDVEPDFPYGHCTIGSQPPTIVGKRTSNLVGPVPTKRFRSASRPRVIMPSSAGASMGIQPPTKTDASSGDTNSFQDEHTTLQGMPRMPKSMEVDSVGDFEKQLSYDLGETSTKTKKKKKGKNLVQSSPFNQGWQLESPILGEQREQSKRRLENHQFESNGTSGLYGQQNAKKQKTTKHSIDNTLDNIIPMSGSISSPMAAQSISNQNKLMKYISGRDRSKKAKMLKAPSSQPGSGSPWTVFEDQALVVLVHDMGPNWELVSDAINSTLQFKCIFRNPRECKERHKSLMDRTAGDGADSAEDSGSSQSYPSTLPGIPKGSARQLFQRLQGPVEEDTIREHFDKIIQIGQKPRQRRVQIENQDSKQIAVHNSHFVALSQVCPNNLNGVVLTPLDLCAEAASNSDVLPLGYQGSHGASLPMPNQGAVGSMLPMSGVYPSPVQGSGGMVLGTNLLSPAFNASIRDGRYNVQRPSSLPADEQQRMQQHNQTVSARTMQQSNLSIPGALSSNNRGRMLPNGNGMGVASAMNRNSPMPRPGFQGLASSSGLNPSNMLSSGMVGVPSTVNMHAGSASNQATSMMRPREALHMMRPGHNLEQQRQMTLPELQMQATQGSSQGIPPINGLGSSFSNQMTAPVQTFPGHSQQQHQMPLQQSHAQNHPQNPQLQGANHAAGSQHQAYAMRLKERQLQQQQRYMQPQQQLAASGSLMPHVQSQSQLPTSLHSSPQIHPRPSSQSAPISPLTPTSSVNSMPSQTAQKHQMPAHGLSRSPQPNVGGLSNQMSKQRQRPLQQQQLQHLGRNHPQQRQQVQAQAQQQAKLVKGVGRGTSLMQQNMSAELSHSNGLPVAHGRLGAEKELMRGQGLYPETSATPIQTSKPLASQSPNHFHLQQHLSSDPASSLSKQQQVPSHSDRRTEVQTSPVPSGQSSARAHQSAPSPLPATNHLEVQLQHQARQKQVNQSPIAQRVIQQNRQITYEPKTNAQTGQVRGEQKPVSNSLQAGTSTALPQASNDSVNMASLTPLPSQWKASDSVYEPLQPASQRILPDGSASRANNIGVLGKELQKQQPNLKQSSASPPSMQQHFQTEEQPSQLEQ